MRRRLYIRLLWMHPPQFRQRFGDEMLADFDSMAGRERWRLVADAVASLFRQWVLRPEFRHAPAAAPADSPALMFQSIEDYKPRGSALAYGGVLSIGVLLAVVFAIGHGGVGRAFSIGIQRPGTGLIPVERSLFQESDSAVGVQAGPEAEDPLKGQASFYFATNRVARALDTDRDLAISAWEIILAPQVLAKIDFDHDGKLSPEECGRRPGSARAGFMRAYPLPAVLDTDHDDEISAREMRNSTAALKRAELNVDGSLNLAHAIRSSGAGR